MKKEKVVKTDNVSKTVQMIQYLRARPKTEMVGLGLIYGAPGLGKSRFARRFAIQNGLFYIRLEATETAKTFSIKLYELICQKYNISSNLKGSTNKMFDALLDIINDVNDEVIIFVDEIDYAFKDKRLLGSIRDIADKTLSVILLVGMQNAKNELLKANAHYFDRCNYFVQYKPLSRKDTGLICKTVCDVKMDDDVISYVHTSVHGNLRKMIKMLHAIEMIAAAKNKQLIQLKDIEGTV